MRQQGDKQTTAAEDASGPSGATAPVSSVIDILESSPWFVALPQAEKDAVNTEWKELSIPAGGWLLRAGEVPPGWFGVVEGLLKWSSFDENGRSISLTGLSEGSWFGEATLIRAKPYAYDVIALRDSRVVLIPRETCERLWSKHLSFTHAVMLHLSERVNMFMGSYTAQFLSSVDSKAARTLASLFHRELHPRTHLHLRISQEEVANLCGISRQRCNVALNRFKKSGLIAIEYGGITVLDLDGLRNFNDGRVGAPERPWAEI